MKLRTRIFVSALALAQLCLASPLSRADGPGLFGEEPKPYELNPATEGLDLPIQQPVYDPNTKKKEPKPVPSPSPLNEDDARDLPPPTFFGEEIELKPNSVIFVIDVSDSMDRDARPQHGQMVGNKWVVDPTDTPIPRRIDIAKAQLVRTIHHMDENILFNVIGFHGEPNSWRPSMEKATKANKISAMAFINGLQIGPGTNIKKAMEVALKEKNNHKVVLLSDGEPSFPLAPGDDSAHIRWASYQLHLDGIRAANTQGAQIDTFAIQPWPNGMRFMQLVSSQSSGKYHLLSSLSISPSVGDEPPLPFRP